LIIKKKMSGYQMVPGADDAKEPNTKKKYNDNDALIKLSTPVLLQAWIQYVKTTRARRAQPR